MKFISVLPFLLMMISCDTKYNYMIKDGMGNYYFCNFYNKTNDGCIMFNNRLGYENTSGYPTRLCNNYKIIKMK